MKTRKNLMLVGALGLGVIVMGAFSASDAHADVCYDRYGNRIVIDPMTLSAAYNCYNTYGTVIVIYPTGPAYVPAPAYGAYGAVGQARRTGRRAGRRGARRYDRRN
jgi:hypothetical protein